MAMYPVPITEGMKFHSDTEYMICTRKKENGGGQVAIKQLTLENDPDWVPWQPPEFREKEDTVQLDRSTLSNEEIIGLVAERFGAEAAEALKPKEEDVQAAPSKKELPEKQNSAMMTTKEMAAVLTGAGIEADGSMKKKDLMAMYKQLYVE